MTNSSHVSVARGRNPEQIKKMEEAKRRGICCLCKEHIDGILDAPVEYKGLWWTVRRNDYPYEGTEFHYMAVYREHIENIEEMAPDAMRELHQHISAIKKKHGAPAIVLVMRTGAMDYTWATLSHLHAHIFLGGPKRDGAEPLLVYAGYKK